MMNALFLFGGYRCYSPAERNNHWFIRCSFLLGLCQEKKPARPVLASVNINKNFKVEQHSSVPC